MTFKRGSWSVFGGFTWMGKEFEGQEGEQVLGSIRLFSRFQFWWSAVIIAEMSAIASSDAQSASPNRRPIS